MREEGKKHVDGLLEALHYVSMRKPGRVPQGWVVDDVYVAHEDLVEAMSTEETFKDFIRDFQEANPQFEERWKKEHG